MTRVRGKEKMARERKAKRAKERIQKERTKKATTMERVAKQMKTKIDAPSVGRQAIRPRSVGSITKGQEKGKGKKSIAAVTEETSSVVSAGPLASQVGGSGSVISFPPSTQHKQKSVGKIGEHRLLMVKAVQEVHSSIQSADAILAEQREVSQLEAILANPVKPFWQ